MAQTYEQWKQSYESMDKAQKQQYADLLKTKSSDYIGNQYATQYAREKGGTTTPTTSTTSTTNTNIAKPEYQGTGTSGTKGSTYTNQGEGNFTYNPKSGYYEKTTNVETPKIETPKAANQELANFWNNLSYEQQQNYLNQNPNLKQSVVSKGLTIKQPEATPTTPTTPTTPEATPKQGEWDYQDDSPERMAEIAQNLEMYKQTMPYLFSDKKAFDDFFINGKGRSQAQIDFLNQWFDNNQKYGKYDALTPESIGAGIAYGDIPEDYLTMLKTTDPAKYMAVLQAKQDAEDKIKDKTALDTTSFLSGEDEDTITSKAIEWLKSQGLFLDKDGNLIDDRTENYATDEEKQYAKDAADIVARNLDIDNTVKHTYDDLVEKYPGATKATLMAMAQDINADLLREKENNNVELTRLQGYMDYMQSERQERTRIGENAINQLQKQYGMYYQYTPEGMSELAQAQYAATNVTLDQADYGTDTQKQMALDAVLTPIYQQYGDIIQRPQAQVINDVMALAKNKGISLSQALEENFMKYLKEKPAYKAMQTAMTNSGWDIKNIYVDGEQQSVWYNPQTGETKPLGYSYNSSTGKYDPTSINDFGEGDYQQNRGNVQNAMREWASEGGNLENAAQNIAANMEGQYLGLNTCGYYVNDYIYGVTGQQGPFGSEIANKRAACTNTGLKGAKVGDAIVFDWTIAGGVNGVLPEYGHVGIITGKNPDGSIDVSSSISGKVQTRTIKPGDAWYKNIYGTRSLNYSSKKDEDPAWHPMYDKITNVLKSDTKLTEAQKENLKNAETMYGYLYRMADDGSLQQFVESSDFQKIMNDVSRQSFTSGDDGVGFANAWRNAVIKNKIVDPVNQQVANRFQRLIEIKLRKESGAAISSSEWLSNFSNLLPQPGEAPSTKQDKLLGWEQGIIYPTFRYSGMPEGYVWLFDTNKGLFPTIGYGQGQQQTPGTTSKGTWNISGTVGQKTVGEVTSPYSSLFNQLNI